MVNNMVQLNIPHDYIVDPENALRSETPPQNLPNFLSWDEATRNISGTPEPNNIGEYLIYMTVEDDYNHVETFYFTIVVKRK